MIRREGRQMGLTITAGDDKNADQTYSKLRRRLCQVVSRGITSM